MKFFHKTFDREEIKILVDLLRRSIDEANNNLESNPEDFKDHLYLLSYLAEDLEPMGDE